MKKCLVILNILVLFLMSGVYVEATPEEKKVLKVGMEAAYAPFNWTQPDSTEDTVPISNTQGEYANGYDVYIAKYLAEELGYDLEIVKTEWDGLTPAVTSGKIDLIIAGMSPTAERKEQIDFSDSYYTSDLVVVLKKDSPFKDATSINDFEGAKITAQLNTFHYTVIDAMEGVVKQTAMKNFPNMTVAVKSGKIDGYISERPGALQVVTMFPDELTFVEFTEDNGFDTDSEDTSIAVGLKKYSPLTLEINKALSKLSEEKRFELMDHAIAIKIQGENLSFFGQIQKLLTQYGPMFARGTLITLMIAIVGTFIGFLIGLVVASIRTIAIKPSRNIARFIIHKLVNFILVAYIEIFRSTPMMVQAILLYYSSKEIFNIDISAMTTAFIIVSINTGAYLSEVVRGGINSVDKGQSEAAKAIGMSHSQTMLAVILPQAIKNILPSIGNEFIINIKDTAVLNVITVNELFFTTSSIVGSTLLYVPAFTITCVIYFILTFVTTRLLNMLEKKLEGKKNFEVNQEGKV